MKTALMVVTRPFYPSDSGRKAVLRSQFEMLKKMGFKISIVLLSSADREFLENLNISLDDRISILQPKTRQATFLRLLGALKKILSGCSLNEAFFWNPVVAEMLKKQPDFDVAYFDMVRSMQYENCIRANKKVFDFDDILSKRYAEKTYSANILGYKSNHHSSILRFVLMLISPLVLRYEAYAIRRREKYYLANKNIKLFVSEKEAMQVRSQPGLDRIFSMPMSFPKRSVRWDPINCKGFLFLGNLDYEPNVESLRYIVDYVLPLMMRDVQIFVVGKTKPETRDKFENRNIVFLGFVENIQDVFITSLALLAPIFSGGGIKTKVVEAFSYGLPVIGSTKAFEGLSMSRDIGLIAHSSMDFANYLAKAMDDPGSLLSLSRNCENYFLENFEEGVVFKKYRSILSESGTG